MSTLRAPLFRPALALALSALAAASAAATDSIATTSAWLPAEHVASAIGDSRTDVEIFNPDPERAAEVTLFFTPAGVDGTSLPGLRITPDLRPRESVTLTDVVVNTLGHAEGFGVLEVRSGVSTPILVTSITYNEIRWADATPIRAMSPTDNEVRSGESAPSLVKSMPYSVGRRFGIHGRFSPGQPYRKAVGFDDSVFGDLYLIGLRSDSNYQTDLALINPTGVDLEAGVQLVAAGGGDPYVSRAYTVPPYSIRPVSDLFEKEFVASGAPRGGPYRLNVFVNVANGARVLCYASVVDRRTGDSYQIPGEPTISP
jgi:hypothetical protein